MTLPDLHRFSHPSQVTQKISFNLLINWISLNLLVNWIAGFFFISHVREG